MLIKYHCLNCGCQIGSEMRLIWFWIMYKDPRVLFFCVTDIQIELLELFLLCLFFYTVLCWKVFLLIFSCDHMTLYFIHVHFSLKMYISDFCFWLHCLIFCFNWLYLQWILSLRKIAGQRFVGTNSSVSLT